MKSKYKSDLSFAEMYKKQVEFQKKILKEKGEEWQYLPADSVHWASYHIQAMVEEMGEVMKADKRWKTHRNTNYDRGEKLDEIADMFITMMNVAIFSGFYPLEVQLAILSKIDKNDERTFGE